MPRLSFEIREDTQEVLARLAERDCRGVRDEARYLFERAVERAARTTSRSSQPAAKTECAA